MFDSNEQPHLDGRPVNGDTPPMPDAAIEPFVINPPDQSAAAFGVSRMVEIDFIPLGEVTADVAAQLGSAGLMQGGGGIDGAVDPFGRAL